MISARELRGLSKVLGNEDTANAMLFINEYEQVIIQAAEWGKRSINILVDNPCVDLNSVMNELYKLNYSSHSSVKGGLRVLTIEW